MKKKHKQRKKRGKKKAPGPSPEPLSLLAPVALESGPACSANNLTAERERPAARAPGHGRASAVASVVKLKHTEIHPFFMYPFSHYVCLLFFDENMALGPHFID